MMQYAILLIAGFAIIVWTIRPLYNFFAKSKYVLLDQKKMSLIGRMKAGLPALAFYIILIVFVLYPAVTSELISTVESSSVIILELIIIFGLSRYDKRQTKYKVTNAGVFFFRKSIQWDEQYQLSYKKTLFFVLHKPRFIMKTEANTIVIPLLSDRITEFIDELIVHNEVQGPLCYDIYNHNKLYYVENGKIAKNINKIRY